MICSFLAIMLFLLYRDMVVLHKSEVEMKADVDRVLGKLMSFYGDDKWIGITSKYILMLFPYFAQSAHQIKFLPYNSCLEILYGLLFMLCNSRPRYHWCSSCWSLSVE